jgi:hypothetical protein
MLDPGLSGDFYYPSQPSVTVPTDDPGITTGVYSADSASAISSTRPTETGPMTGFYDPEWAAALGIEI